MKKSITNYNLTEKLHESSSTLVYRAVQIQDHVPVILKVLQPANPAPEELSRFQCEYDITHSFNNDGIIRVFRMEAYDNTLMIIEEDIAAKPLDILMKRRSLTLEECLFLAVRIAENVGHIHAANVIHKNLNPSNIIWNPKTDQVKIIDFGIASRLPSESFTLKNPGQLEGTLAYLSPEQTGRINRSIDYRTDLYSLGVTLYEMFTGQLPFTTTDAIELVHGHIAKKPSPLCEINADIPPIVSHIIMKLLEKNAEDRYQSALGVKVDLEKCQEHLANKQNITDLQFELGQNDFSGQFQIPQKLYGRESEIITLLEAFDRVSSGKAEAIIVAGYSGIGKTVLVHEVHKPMTEKHGYFIAGKFDQFKQNIPYYAITQAFNEFCRSLLKESSETLQNWKSKILDAVGNNGQVIIDVIPDLELVIGAQPAVAEVGPTEAQNRFNLYFLNFFKALCDKDHPLIIFLDDLQWADLPTLNLVNLMMTDSDTQFLLFIGAYRDNEISDVHPLPRILDNIQKQTPLTNIILPPLGFSHVNNLISDSTISSLGKSKSLAKVVYEKTGGNPFFVNMFLKTIAGKKLVAFDFNKGEWTWDVQLIRSLDITNNVVDMMVDRISQLPAETRKILSLAACLGSRFNLRILSLVYGHSGSVVFDELWKAVLDGLIIPIEDDYKWIEHSPEEDHEAMFRFLHDRVQQAAYSLIPKEERSEIHLKIGRLLQNSLTEEEFDENLFEIANHFNQGKELISGAIEREKITRLNLKTARKAKLSSAYLPALRYINICKEYLPVDSWEKSYDLTLACFFEKGEIEYLNAQWDDAIATFDEALEKVVSQLDRSRIFKFKVTLFRMKNDLKDSLDLSLHALKELGYTLNPFPDDDEVIKEIEHFKPILAGSDSETLYNLPQLQDPLKLIALEIMSELMPPAFFLGSRLVFIVGMKMAEITMQYGNSSYSAVGYIFYSGFTLAIYQRDYDNAYNFGLLALRLNDEKYQEKANEALILDMWGSFVCHYKAKLNIASDYLLRGYYSGVENGSYQWAGYNGVVHLFTCFWGVNSLKEVSETIKKLVPGMKKVDPNMVNYYYAVKATIFNLTDVVSDPIELSDSNWPNIEKVLEVSREQNDMLTLLVNATCRLSLANWYSDIETALILAMEADTYVQGVPGVYIDPVFHFHQSIAFSQGYNSVDSEKQIHFLAKLEANIDKFNLWASHGSETYTHQALLLRAELARIKGNKLEAMDLYDEAISSAAANGFTQNEAFANELCARFYLALNKKKIAGVSLNEASNAYQRWGATAKVKNLETQYPQFLDHKISQDKEARVVSSQPDTTMDSPSRQKTTSIQLDLESVMKASHILSGEIVLSRLLKKMMHLVIENAGATRGLLILEKDGQWMIEAEGFPDVDEVTVMQALPIEESEQVPATLINYISRTRENVVLSDATGEDGFAKDAYIIKKQPKSVLGLPLLNHGILNGILYLENNLTTGAFTTDRLQVITLLAFQAGISLENARLFEEKQKNGEELVEEIADRKQAEEALRESEERFRAAFDSAQDCVLIWDKEYNYLYANQAAIDHVGTTPDQVIGKNIRDGLRTCSRIYASLDEPH